MTECPWKSKHPVREATEDDIPQLAVHHRKMFEEIWERRGHQVYASIFVEMETAYARKLEQELLSGSCKAWIIEDTHAVVASGAVTVVSFVPTPADASSKVAYLHSMYTEKGFRNNSFANRIVESAIQYCQANGIKRIVLDASEAGRPIYEKIGFGSAPEFMRFLIPDCSAG